jgi:predicted nucleic acid-binding protein
MIYFDTDVLINLLIPQDKARHLLAKTPYHSATDKHQFFISVLCLQELAHVLHKLEQNASDIEGILSNFLTYQPVAYGVIEMTRGILLAKQIGFQNINDCIHTAISETHCTEIYTFNKADFNRIRKYSNLKITVL